MNKELFEINKKYPILKQDHKRNTETYFNKKVSESQIKVDENKMLVNKIEKLTKSINSLGKRLSRYNFLKVSIYILTIISFIVAGIGIYILAAIEQNKLAGGLMTAFGIIGFIGFLLLYILIIRKKIKKIENEKDILEKEKEENIEKAYDTLIPLFSIIDYNIQQTLFQQTLPLIYLDKHLDLAKYNLLKEKYGFYAFEDDNNISVTKTQSGHISGNPFILMGILKHELGTKTHQNSITVSYQEKIYVNKRPQYVTKYETLTAYVTKPYPYYSNSYILAYGNEAAENLTFERYPSGIADASNVDKFIKSKVKEVRKDAERIQKTNPGFTLLTNDEFEAIFGALDRDNESQYRVLMTASAQKEFMDMFKNKEYGYQDKFIFKKLNLMNYVIPYFIPTTFNFEFGVEEFIHYDLEMVRELFITNNLKYFKFLYYVLAPILSISVYRNHKPREYIYKKTLKQRYPSIQYEEIANKYQNILNPLSKTLNIFKTTFLNQNDEGDEVVNIKGYGYKITKMVDYITKSDSRGRTHTIPVTWDLYTSVESNDIMTIKNEDFKTTSEFNNKYHTNQTRRYTHSLVSFLQQQENDLTERKIRYEDVSEVGLDSNDLVEFGK